MIRFGTPDAARDNRRHLVLANGTGYWRSDFIAPPAQRAQGERWAPQAFLVEQDAGSVILPHFHLRDEFQVVVDGEGTLGRHPVRPVGVHYAGRHTGYGPITSGRQGLAYFSLRAVADPGARFLPEARGEMQKLPKRHLLAFPAAGEVKEPDGIGIWLLQVHPNETLPAPRHGAGSARFYIVTEGALRHDGARLERLATLFVCEEEMQFCLEAAEEGARVLALQFPFDSPGAV